MTQFIAEVNDTDAIIFPKIYTNRSDTGGKFAISSNDRRSWHFPFNLNTVANTLSTLQWSENPKHNWRIGWWHTRNPLICNVFNPLVL